MHHIILWDTEYTAWEGCNERGWVEPWQHREIIQIAAQRVALPSWDVVAEFMVLVQPQLNPQLSGYIQTLTGLRQADIDQNGLSPAAAFAQFAAFCKQTPLYAYGTDWQVLNENCQLLTIPNPIPAHQANDFRPLLQTAGVRTEAYSSGTVYKAAGLSLTGHQHNAMFDVTSMRLAAQALNVQVKPL